MHDIAEEIEQARLSLGLPERMLRLLPPDEGLAIFQGAEAHFVNTQNRTWWWEDFRKPGAGHHFADGSGWRHLKALVPSATDSLWFIGADRHPRWRSPVYETDTTTAQAVIGQSYPFEYYLVAHDLSWLLGENHHDVVFAVGEPVESNLRGLASQYAA